MQSVLGVQSCRALLSSWPGRSKTAPLQLLISEKITLSAWIRLSVVEAEAEGKREAVGAGDHTLGARRVQERRGGAGDAELQRFGHGPAFVDAVEHAARERVTRAGSALDF